MMSAADQVRNRTQIIVLNGGSSSGKSTIVRRLQQVLPRPWLHLGVDELVAALPPALLDSDDGIEFGSAGQVRPGDGFRAAESAWLTGLAAMARSGAQLIVDDVFLEGALSQQRMRDHFEELVVLWVGVRCDPAVAVAREQARGDRTAGMAASQAEVVHHGVSYDFEVDTSRTTAENCARSIAERVR